MGELPPGWESDYDGRRWFYTYKPTGNVQYHFPSEGDEFPDFIDASLPAPGLAPEERLESTKQRRRQGSLGRPPNTSGVLSSGRVRDAGDADCGDDGKEGGYMLSAIARPLSDVYEDGQDEKVGQDIFQPESFMYLGPGAYQNVSPLVEEEQEDETARRLVVGGVDGTANGISPLASERNTPLAGKSELSLENAGGTVERQAVPVMGTGQQSIAELGNNEKLTPEAGNEGAAVPGSSGSASVIAEMEAPAIPQIIETIHEEAAAMLDGKEMPHELPVDNTTNRIDPVGTVAEMASEHTPQSLSETEPVELEGSNSVMSLQKMAIDEGVSELDGCERSFTDTSASIKSPTIETSHSPSPTMRKLVPEPTFPVHRPHGPVEDHATKQVTVQSDTQDDTQANTSPSMQGEVPVSMEQGSGGSASGTPSTSRTAPDQPRASSGEGTEALTHAPSVLKPASRKEMDPVASPPGTMVSAPKRIVRKSLPSYVNDRLALSHPTVLRPRGISLSASGTQMEDQDERSDSQPSQKDMDSTLTVNGQRADFPSAGQAHPVFQQHSNNALHETLPYPRSPTLARASVSQDRFAHESSILGHANGLSGQVSPIELSGPGSVLSQQMPIPASLNPYHQLPPHSSSPLHLPQAPPIPYGTRPSSVPAQMQGQSQHQQILMQPLKRHEIPLSPSSKPVSGAQPNLQQSHTINYVQDTSGTGTVIDTIQEDRPDEVKSPASPFFNSITSISEASDSHSTTTTSSPNTPQSAAPPPGDVNVPQRPGPTYPISLQHQELLEEQHGAKANVRHSTPIRPVSSASSQKQPPQPLTIQPPQTLVGANRSHLLGGQPVPLGVEANVKVKEKGNKWTKWFKSSPKPQPGTQQTALAGYPQSAPVGAPLNGAFQAPIIPQQLNGPPPNTSYSQNPSSVQMMPPPNNHPQPMVSPQSMPLQPNVGPNVLGLHATGPPPSGVPMHTWPQQIAQPQKGFSAQPQPFHGQPYQQIPAPVSVQNNGMPMPPIQVPQGPTIPLPKPGQVLLNQPAALQRYPGPPSWQQPYQAVPQQPPALTMPPPGQGTIQQVQSRYTYPLPPNSAAPVQGPNVLRKNQQPQAILPQRPHVQMAPQPFPPTQRQVVTLPPGTPYQTMAIVQPAPLIPGPHGLARYPQGAPSQGYVNTAGPHAWPAQPIYANVQQR